MRWFIMTCALLTALLIPLPGFASDNNKSINARVQAIAADLSCVVCSGQSVASSNAALARDMRAFIAAKLREGKSEAQIKTFLQRRYGDKILMRPPVKPATYILWAAPVIALLIGLGIIYSFYRRGRRQR
jgi:cytochrome c-type biogenesis protein CcmH